jgi:hypothetical protein
VADLDIKALWAPEHLDPPMAPGLDSKADRRAPRIRRDAWRPEMQSLVLAVDNESEAMGGAIARLESTNEAGVTVVQEMEVLDVHGGRNELCDFRFPTELGPGVIRHQVTLVDADPENDVATAETRVSP